jgi:hypothetical protein
MYLFFYWIINEPNLIAYLYAYLTIHLLVYLIIFLAYLTHPQYIKILYLTCPQYNIIYKYTFVYFKSCIIH